MEYLKSYPWEQEEISCFKWRLIIPCNTILLLYLFCRMKFLDFLMMCPCISLRTFIKFGASPSVSGSQEWWSCITVNPSNSDNPSSSSLLGCLIVPVGFETSRKKTEHFLICQHSLYVCVGEESLVSEVVGKRLQNVFVLLFPQVCKLYILVKVFILEFLHVLPHRTIS